MSDSAPTPPRTTAALSDEERAAALRAPRAPIPTKFIAWTASVLLVLGLGGVLVEHFFGNVGLPSSRPPSGLTSTTRPGGPLETGLDAFIGLRGIGSARAPGFTLTDQSGRAWRLKSARGTVTVLTFYGEGCRDICPVLGAELKQTDEILRAHGLHATFVVVNTDPFALTVASAPPALTHPRLQGLANVEFLTGSLRHLSAVWSAYGVQVRVGTTAAQVVHNDVIYLVSPRGRLVDLATPFANENRRGQYDLAASEVHRFARGLAAAAASLSR